MKKALIIANWKMYVEKPDAAKKFAVALRKQLRHIPHTSVVIAPPFPLLPTVALALKGSVARVGAQTISGEKDEKHTGGVSAGMLKAAGASMVIIGHSERRAQGETDDIVRAQVERAQEAGLTAVLCVGEKEQDATGVHFNFIAEQLTHALSGAKISSTKLVIAYEPVWAIGKSAIEAMAASDVREMVIFIRKTLADILGRPLAVKVPILYGGSVEAGNAKELLEEGQVGGFLVGHASAEWLTFNEILKNSK